MLKKTIFVLFVISICVAGALWPTNPAWAIHKGAGGLVCGNCHTMHNSQGSTSTGDGNGGLGGNTGGSLIMLRGQVSTRAEIHKLCLQCHATNGAQASVSHTPQNVQAPKVYSSAAWDDTMAFNAIGAGGNFSTELSAAWTATTTPALGYGHSLGATNVVPPGGDLAISEFSCTNCHDPHGTTATTTKINVFRNLRVNATGASASSGVQFITDAANPQREHRSYVGGVNGSYFGGSETDGGGNVIWPVYKGALGGTPALDNGKTNSYGTGDDNNSGRATMAKWCAQCHDQWHEAIQINNWGYGVSGPFVADPNYTQGLGPDWKRHSVNGMMPRKAKQGCALNCHISLLGRENYDSALITAGKGLPVTASDYYPGNLVYYLPYETPCDGGICMDASGGGSARDNHKVFCLSCHFAHGGPYRDNLRWDYLSSVAQGSQNGNSIASTKGCQLCHNR
ncbi:MAG: hypothetical protein HY886_08130 [Deltaproteobacteria bacterium]|nr:hypothetical protein [Deltaproteobacteria bacterium]